MQALIEQISICSPSASLTQRCASFATSMKKISARHGRRSCGASIRSPASLRLGGVVQPIVPDVFVRPAA
jgi:hypothetical protein